MSKSSTALQSLPNLAVRSITTLGADLRIARERRGESLRAMSARMNVSVPTLRRMEAGDPAVSLGIYATALWLFDRVEQLEALMDPHADAYATRLDIERSSRARRRS
ncbi:helix-turn-helix domain-containing protein [Sulfitobacter sp. 1A13353]|uniref:helix-turn-helix domain-containing protein n=1 Tax=Sulfitobacter sp. 1A13353 TaxID=3368568 RepID=UPI003746944D